MRPSFPRNRLFGAEAGRQPRRRTERSHSMAPAKGSANCRATMPNKKAGPGRLQKPSRISPSRRFSCPRCTAWATQAAPAGYPPSSAGISSDSAPFGRPNSFPMGDNIRSFRPMSRAVSSMERHRKGSREGITAVRHSSTPWLAPCMAVFPSRIMPSIPSASSTPTKHHLGRIYASRGLSIHTLAQRGRMR